MKNPYESAPEKVLNEAEIMEQFRILLADSRILRFLSAREFPYSGEDFVNISKKYVEGEEFPYLLEAEIRNGVTGEMAQFMYNRKGEFPGISSSETEIHVVYYDSNKIPCGSELFAVYRSDIDEWKVVE